MYDEQTALRLAGYTTLEKATEFRNAVEKLHASEVATYEGLKVELDIALDALRHWQSRIHGVPADVDVVLTKLAAGSPKASLVAAGELYTRHQSEQTVVRNVVAIKERALAIARRNLERGELALLRADLERKKADALLLAIKHVEAGKIVRAMDESIELPIGKGLTAVVDDVIALQQLIARKESKS